MYRLTAKGAAHAKAEIAARDEAALDTRAARGRP
jgi:hypothetical protein